MRIVLDAMGTDECPVPDVAGAILAARESGDTIILIGDEALIRREINKQRTADVKLEIVHATQVITMEDKPSVVGKAKPDSSMHVGLRLVQDHSADAFVTAGNTGAAQAIAMLFTLHRIPGIRRPALSAIFPFNQRPITFLDIGANTDSKAEWLAQFALMGQVYAQNALGINRPRVGLLSNGAEEGKGTQATREASTILQQLPLSLLNYIGNIEPRDIMHGTVDVVVSDGFTGNILIKTFESSTRYLVNVLRDEMRRNVLSTLGALLARPAFNNTRRRLDTSEVGGAPLLGVNGVVIIAHGRSTPYAIKNALLQAHKAVDGHILQSIEEGISALDLDATHLQAEI
ncbi:MAG: phosphate acyltransferase PlsX [Chitinophagaceae bacterium]|nr:phosphate acyltransferase PlsX [Anaerolineae bacterium]